MPNWENINTDIEPEVYSFSKHASPASKKYKPPPSRRHPMFIAKWNDFIEDVVGRENFKVTHLHQLVTLCDLYVEYERIQKTIECEGIVYFTEGGRNGPQLKKRPEFEQLNKTRAEIRSYLKTMGLLLMKDKSTSGEEEEAGEWE